MNKRRGESRPEHIFFSVPSVTSSLSPLLLSMYSYYSRLHVTHKLSAICRCIRAINSISATSLVLRTQIYFAILFNSISYEYISRAVVVESFFYWRFTIFSSFFVQTASVSSLLAKSTFP